MAAPKGIVDELARELRWLAPRLLLRDVAVFSGNLATCLGAGLSVPDSLETCTHSSPKGFLRSSGKRLAEKTRGGASLSEALEEIALHLPRFYLPAVRCGEESGRTEEALRYLEEHCRLLDRPYQSMRNLWLVPLAFFLVAQALFVLAAIFCTSFLGALSTLWSALWQLATLAAVVLLVGNVTPLRRLFDRLLLMLPVIGPCVRDLSVNRFFHAFGLLYSTSGMSVPRMFRLACDSVGNLAVQDDFLAAIPYLEQGRSLSESLDNCPVLNENEKTMLASGEEAGRLADALGKLCQQTAESLQVRLETTRTLCRAAIIVVYVFGTAAYAGQFLALVLQR